MKVVFHPLTFGSFNRYLDLWLEASRFIDLSQIPDKRWMDSWKIRSSRSKKIQVIGSIHTFFLRTSSRQSIEYSFFYFSEHDDIIFYYAIHSLVTNITSSSEINFTISQDIEIYCLEFRRGEKEIRTIYYERKRFFTKGKKGYRKIFNRNYSAWVKSRNFNHTDNRSQSERFVSCKRSCQTLYIYIYIHTRGEK